MSECPLAGAAPSSISGEPVKMRAFKLAGTRSVVLEDIALPNISDLPAGAIMVAVRLVSTCGSDTALFRRADISDVAWTGCGPGFCGHEVVGLVVASSSPTYPVGRPVLCLPAAYFTSHSKALPDWFSSVTHGVLRDPRWPMLGGFAEVVVSHELCCVPVPSVSPRWLFIQPVATMLRCFARLPTPLLGKRIAVLGLGQNGIMCATLCRQMGAAAVVGIDPIPARRTAALAHACSAVLPAGTPADVAAACGGAPPDVVFEMVGHCEETINEALELVAHGGVVVAFGVNDTDVYTTFRFGRMFRRNVTIVPSVFPCPTRDLPLSRSLLTAPFGPDFSALCTHTLPFERLGDALELSDSKSDGVIKVVLRVTTTPPAFAATVAAAEAAAAPQP